MFRIALLPAPHLLFNLVTFIVHIKVYPEGSVAENGTFIATASAVHTGQLFFDNDTLNAAAATSKLFAIYDDDMSDFSRFLLQIPITRILSIGLTTFRMRLILYIHIRIRWGTQQTWKLNG